MPGFLSMTQGFGSESRFIMVMLSNPPPMAASAPPRMIWWAAMTMAWSPEEQKRLTVVPATDTGRPARTSATRATLLPCAPLGWAQPRITSSISTGSSCGTLPSTSRMQWAAKSSGRVRLNEPRKDLASGVRELATTTASLMASPFVTTLTEVYPMPGSAHRPAASPLAELGRGTAVHDDGRPRHERRGLRGQEDARVGNLVHLAPAPHAHAIGHGVVGLLGRRGILLGERSEEHTSELQSRENLVCRLLL